MTLTMTVKEVKENLGIIVEPGKYQLSDILCCATDRTVERNIRKVRKKP